MTDFRRVTDKLSVAPQIDVEDVEKARAEGFVRIVNNRPDGESPDQTPSGRIEAAARAAGLDYVHIPVMGGPTQAQAQAMHEACNGAGGPVLAYCRSGTRSITTWALGEVMAGSTPRDELAERGAAAGYDLRPVLGV
jgi:uncharacterized protein (TIGR01244 family)